MIYNRFKQFQISVMKRQFVITQTIRQTLIPALLGSLVTHAPSVQNLVATKNACP